jgi:hypothetical protein
VCAGERRRWRALASRGGRGRGREAVAAARSDLTVYAARGSTGAWERQPWCVGEHRWTLGAGLDALMGKV